MMELPMKLLSTPMPRRCAAEATFHSCFFIVAPLVGLVMAGPRRQPRTGRHTVRLQGAMPKPNVSPSKWFQKVFSMKNLGGVPQEHHQGDGARRYRLVVMRIICRRCRHPAGDDLDYVGSSRDGCQRPAAHGGGRLLRHRRRGLSFSEMAVHQEPYDVER